MAGLHILGTTEIDSSGHQLKHLYQNNLIAAATFDSSTSGENGVVPLTNVSIKNRSDLIEKTSSNYLKIKKTGYYRITMNARFRDMGNEPYSVSAGIGINGAWSDQTERNTWITQNNRGTVNAVYILNLTANQTITVQWFKPYSGGGIGGVLYVEYLY